MYSVNKTKEETVKKLLSFTKEGDTILIKGSRATGMEEIVQRLIRE